MAVAVRFFFFRLLCFRRNSRLAWFRDERAQADFRPFRSSFPPSAASLPLHFCSLRPQAGGTRLLKQFTPLMGGLDDVKITVSPSRPPFSLPSSPAFVSISVARSRTPADPARPRSLSYSSEGHVHPVHRPHRSSLLWIPYPLQHGVPLPLGFLHPDA